MADAERNEGAEVTLDAASVAAYRRRLRVLTDGLGPGAEPAMHVLYSSVSAVLAGAVWGDHCSPISDTTILSSLASSCDHVDHVRTQLPYALTTGGVALFLGTLPVGFGLPWWVGMGVGAAVLWAVLRFVGQPVEPASASAAAASAASEAA